MIVFVYIAQNNKRIEELVNQQNNERIEELVNKNEKLITEMEGLTFETVLLILESEVMSQCRDVYIIYKLPEDEVTIGLGYFSVPKKFPQGLVDCQNYWKDIDTELYDKIKDFPFKDPATDLEKKLEEFIEDYNLKSNNYS